MRRMGLGLGEAGPLSLLAVGCHADDLEIGCGGTVLDLASRGALAKVWWVVLSGAGERAGEARAAAEELLAEVPHEVLVQGFRESFMPWEGERVKAFFESLREQVDPDAILTHQRDDLHQDHRLAAELALNTFRDHLILGFEIPKYDGDLGAPNAYVPLSAPAAERKIDLLGRHFASQRGKQWYDAAVFRGLMRLRGMECNAPSGYAEAFYARKIVL